MGWCGDFEGESQRKGREGKIEGEEIDSGRMEGESGERRERESERV